MMATSNGLDASDVSSPHQDVQITEQSLVQLFKHQHKLLEARFHEELDNRFPPPELATSIMKPKTVRLLFCDTNGI